MKQIISLFIYLLLSANLIAQSVTTEDMYDIGKRYYDSGDYNTAFTYFQKGANEGDYNCENMLGGMFQFGYGVNIDINKAIDYYTKAAEKGHSFAQYNMGRLYYKGQSVPQDYSKAITWFTKSANQGYHDAQYYLGIIYQNGYGTTQDYMKALEWYKKSALQGNQYAQGNLGDMYFKGQGVPQDYLQAKEWYEKSANQGYAHAQSNLGWLYETGNGISKDYTKAIEWYNKAAAQDDQFAQSQLAAMYLIGNVVPKDYQKAKFWYEKIANKGDAYAQYVMGTMYDYGNGVEQNYSKAVEWYKKSAEQGYAYGQYCLATMYFGGYGVKQDYSIAIDWLTKAALQGNTSSQRLLGGMYYDGKGCKKDYTKALDWYTKAANQGDYSAMNGLGWHYYLGDGFKKDYQKAEMWFKKAIETDANSPYSYSNLGLLYAQRDKNYTEALRYSDMAIARIANVNLETQAVFYGERGQIYVWKGDMDNAEKMLKKCLEMNPNYLDGDDEFSKMMVSYHSNEVDSKIISNPIINSNTFAIIIGNEKYKNEVSVPFANNDAKIFKEYVEKTLGVPHEQIRLVENAGYNDLRMAVNWLAQAMTVCKGKGKAIVYYAGHGIPNESDLSAYLLPVDGIGNDPGSAYSLKDMYEKLGSVEAQSITIFLDACFSGSKREEGMLASARGVALRAKQSAPKGNMVIFSAAQGDETAYPYKDKQHGLFTYFLLKKLQESKGEVTLGELSEYLTEEVGRQSFVKNNKMQTPTVYVSSPLENSWRQMKLK